MFRIARANLGELAQRTRQVGPQMLLERLAQASARASRAAKRLIPFDAEAGPVSSAVIADAVTLLSSNWTDINSLTNPFTLNNRPATTTWYRLAIAAGKNINFKQPTNWAAAADYGTDGGVHNFLRYLENWSGQSVEAVHQDFAATLLLANLESLLTRPAALQWRDR